MCMLKLVLYKPGKWHNIRAIINLIYICRDMQIYVYIYTYTHYLGWLYIYIFYLYEYTYLFTYIHIHIHMIKWDGFCNAAW